MDDETRLVPAHDRAALMKAETTAPVPVGVDELATKVIAALDTLSPRDFTLTVKTKSD